MPFVLKPGSPYFLHHSRPVQVCIVALNFFTVMGIFVACLTLLSVTPVVYSVESHGKQRAINWRRLSALNVLQIAAVNIVWSMLGSLQKGQEALHHFR